MEIITLEESQMIFEDVKILRNFLINKYNFSIDEINILLSYSLDMIHKTMLIDIIYNAFGKLEQTENRNDVENNLYKKLIDILNYHVAKINFKDKKSNFIKELEYSLLHFEGPDFGISSKKK